MSLNYYHILEIDYNATQEDVKLAYRKLAKQYHPDVNAGNADKAEMFKQVSEAYKVLSDLDRKAAYDLRLLLGIHEDITAANAYTYDTRSRTFRPRFRTYYRREPVQYSRKTYFAATAFLVCVVSAIFLVPLSLSRYSSAYNYDKGLEYYKNGQYYASLHSLDRAIVDFGNKNIESCLLASTILMQQFGQYTYAIEYADKGLRMAKSDRERVQLLYMKGQCQKAGADYYAALKQFKEAKRLWPEYDSLYYAAGEIYAFHLDNYPLALENYDKLITLNRDFPEGYYGRAYSHFKLQKNEEAMADIEQYLSLNGMSGKAYLLKGELELRAGNTKKACVCFEKASLLHTREAEKFSATYCE